MCQKLCPFLELSRERSLGLIRAHTWDFLPFLNTEDVLHPSPSTPSIFTTSPSLSSAVSSPTSSSSR